MPSASTNGYTLVEAVVTIAILLILIATAAPSVATQLESRRASGAAEAIQTLLYLARSESIKQMRPMVVSYAANGVSTWSIGVRNDTTCDPGLSDPDEEDACSIQESSARVLKAVTATNFRDVSVTTSRDFTRFEPNRATAAGSNVTIRVSTASGREVHVIVANSGRIRSCSPADHRQLPGYPAC